MWKWSLSFCTAIGVIWLAATNSHDRFNVASSLAALHRNQPQPTTDPALATVFLNVTGTDRHQQPAKWFGSAVALSQDGLLVTNRHVAPGDDRLAKSIRAVFQPGTASEFECLAKLIFVHPDRDLALLQCQLGDRQVDWLALAPRNMLLTHQMPIRYAGFPLGAKLSVDQQSAPAVSIRSSHVSGFRHNDQHRLWWVDLDTGTIGGSSGGPAINSQGQVVGIMTRARAEFSRCIPVAYVHETLGLKGLKVESKLDDQTASVSVTPGLSDFDLVDIRVSDTSESVFVHLTASGPENALSGQIELPSEAVDIPPVLLKIQATTNCGLTLNRIVRIDDRIDQSPRPVRFTIVQARISTRGNYGVPFDLDAPDPFVRLLVNGVQKCESLPTNDSAGFRLRTSVDCFQNDKVTIAFWDHDLTNHDFVDQMKVIATPECLIEQPLPPKISAIRAQTRTLPYRTSDFPIQVDR